MILSILYLLFYAMAGVQIGRRLFKTESFPRRLWLGLTVGLFGSIWMPSLFSFLLDFGTLSHILGAALMALLTGSCLLQKRKSPIATRKDYRQLLPLLWLLPIFLVGAYQEILGDLHNLFGDTNAVHVSVDEKGYYIDQVIDGETVADVLEYVQYSPKKLVRTVETWVTKCVKDGKITVEEGKEFLSNYRSGLYGYTYLE